MLITAAMLLAVQSSNLMANNNSTTLDEMLGDASPATAAAAAPRCWSSYSCGPATAILGYYVNIPDVRECASECNNNARCGHFTYFSVGMLEHVCFLFQACERRNHLCQGACASGPRCSPCAPCSSGGRAADRQRVLGGEDGGHSGEREAERLFGKRRLNILRATRKRR